MKPKLAFYCLNYFIRCINFSEVVNKVNRKYLLHYDSWWKKFFKKDLCYTVNAPSILKNNNKKFTPNFSRLLFRSK